MHPTNENEARASVVVERDWIRDAYRVTRSLTTGAGVVLVAITSWYPTAIYDAVDVEQIVNAGLTLC